MSVPAKVSTLDTSSLARFLEPLASGRRALQEAQAALVSDKQRRRASGILARLVDFFRETDQEKVVREAHSGLRYAVARAEAAVHSWVEVGTDHLLALDAQATAELNQAADSHREAVDRYASARKLDDLARAASNAVREAISECESASMMELVDMATKSKSISALSYLNTASASGALEEATRAFSELTEALPAHCSGHDLGSVDDTLDLVVDLMFDLPFDILSFLNVSKLDEAVSRCKQAQTALAPLARSLEEAARTHRELVEQRAAAITALRRPFRAAAAAQVPLGLQEFVRV